MIRLLSTFLAWDRTPSTDPLPKHCFDFLNFVPGRLAPPPEGHVFVPIRVINAESGASRLTYGLLDTGASSCVFPCSLAVGTGHSLKGIGVKSSLICGIEQRQIPSYLHTFIIELFSPAGTRVVWRSPHVQVHCVEHEPSPLLGFRGFLSHFKNISIAYPARTFTLEW